MSEFEYFAACISIVLALAIARCLDAIPASFDRGRRYWVHFVWLLIKLSNPLVLLWSIWQFRNMQGLSFAALTWGLVIASTLYLQVIALVTSDPAAVRDWRTHYYSKRRLFFGANIFYIAQLFLGNIVTARSFNATAVIQLTVIGLSALAMLSAQPRLHAIVAILGAASIFGALFSILGGASGAV